MYLCIFEITTSVPPLNFELIHQFYDTWYDCYAAVECPNLKPTVGYNSMVDAQTCEVGVTLVLHNVES